MESVTKRHVVAALIAIGLASGCAAGDVQDAELTAGHKSRDGTQTSVEQTSTGAIVPNVQPDPHVKPLISGAVDLPGLNVSAPSPRVAGLDEVELLQDGPPKEGMIGGVRFRQAGPVTGTFVASITISYRVGEAPEGQTEDIAKAVNPSDLFVVESMRDVELAHWPTIGSLDGRDIGQGDRNFSLYVFGVQSQVYQIHLDGIDEEQGRAYVEEFIGAIS